MQRHGRPVILGCCSGSYQACPVLPWDCLVTLHLATACCRLHDYAMYDTHAHAKVITLSPVAFKQYVMHI